MARKQLSLFAILAVALVVAALVLSLAPTPASKGWPLPKALSEASGLAPFQGRTLLAHNDELAVIYQVNVDTGEALAVAQLGQPPLAGDFEGIARRGDTTWLVTSTGKLYQFELPYGGKAQALKPKVLDTGLKDLCEIEGLVAAGDELLLPCKTAYVKEYQGALVVFAYGLLSGQTRVLWSIPAAELPGVNKIRPTAIEQDAANYYVITRKQLLVIAKGSLKVSSYQLPTSRHKQPEGLAILASGEVVIVEDNRKGSRLHIYPSLEDL